MERGIGPRSAYREYAGLPAGVGLLVDSVTEGSPAAEAGIQNNDIITSFNGHIVGTRDALREALSEIRPGQRIVVVILRGEEEISITMTVGSRE